jgi:hypothetical protein
MVADSFRRILEKIRASAMTLGTFRVGVLGRSVRPGPNDRLPIHESVLTPLLSVAEECRVYGVSQQSCLADLLSQIGRRELRVWKLDVHQEVVKGYEPLWNSTCEHNGIVVVTRASPRETQSILDSCGRPESWGSRNQLYQGTSRTAVSYCFDVVHSRAAFAFLFSGSNGLEWMDVFADSEQLPILWDQAMRKVMERKPT